MNTNVHIINSQNVSNIKNTQPKLHSGSVVQGKVISHNGGDTYSVSIAGQKINVKSQIQLQTGSFFTAKLGVNSSEETVILKLISTASETKGFSTVSLQNFNPSNPVINNLLNSLGLPVTSESLKLVQFALSMGVKIDGLKLNRAVNRSKNKQSDNIKEDDEKNQTGLLLEEKGLGVTPDAVQAITQRYGNNKDDECGQSEKSSDYDSLIKDYCSSVKEASLKNKKGPLTLFNSLKPVNQQEGHWIVLPFQWPLTGYSGVIRVLLSSNINVIDKIIIDCQKSRNSLLFVLYYETGVLKSVQAGSDSNILNDGAVKKLQNQLQIFLNNNNLKVEIADFNQLSGFLTEDFNIPLFNGEA